MDDWKSRLSPARYAMRVDKDVVLTARDGARVAVDVYRPDAPGRFPALLSMSPYGKDIQRVGEVALPVNPVRGNGGQEAGDSTYFVPRGYVHVVADVRGSGDSGGEFSYGGRLEQEGGYDLVEWIAGQPWCDGNVGMLGMSYFGRIQLLTAAQNPPHLRAIAPLEANTDAYRHAVYHGGIFCLGFFRQWWGHVSVGHTPPSTYRELGEAEVARRVRALLPTDEVRNHPALHIALRFPEKNPVLFDHLIQPLDGPYYWERSAWTKLDRIRIPCLLGVRWSAWPIHLPGAFAAWEAIDAPKKLLLYETESPYGPMRPWRDHHDLILRWYDHWLKGNDTGMMKEPPIRLLVKGTGEWRVEHEWPLARTRWTKLFLRANGVLSETPPDAEPPDEFTNEPFLLPAQAVPGLHYATPPLAEPLEVTGPLALVLHASLDRSDATWMVVIRDVAPDGTSRIVTKGWLRASHRQLDPKRSKPYQPYHPHTESVPVTPGAATEYAIEIREAANVFKAGHRLVLDIRGQDTPAEDMLFFHLGNQQKTVHTIHHDRANASYLLVPAIPR